MRRFVTCLGLGVCACAAASAGELFILSDPSGLSAEAEFTLLNPTTLEVRLKNTSTDVPDGFDSADQILTGVSWDFGQIGVHASDPKVTGGSVVIGAASQSLNFSTGSYGTGQNAGGEYGYGNSGISGALANMISANTAGATPFGGPNLDGPSNLNGPQGGLVANPMLMSLGGLGAIQNEIVATLTIDQALVDLAFLYSNFVRVEFGSDAAFITTPEPGALVMLVLGGLALRRR